jgi:ParB/RepB/Spo0J family partition protein
MAPKSKLTAEIEESIYADHLGGANQFSLAETYGLSQPTISRAIASAKARRGEPAAATAPTSILDVTGHAHFAPSPLNPRKRFDADSLGDLWASISTEGVLLPLLVRHHPTQADRMEIIAGERRWRAVQLGIDQGEADGDFPIPFRLINPCDDRKLLELALTENVARQNMTPLEEAEAFAALAAQGASASDIADVVGMDKRTVQKRLRLVKDLTPQTREALADGRISVEQANVIAAYCQKSKQGEAVSGIVNGSVGNTAGLKRSLLSGRYPETRAFFDPQRYTGAWVVDEETGARYFADTAQFKTLQDHAVAARAEDLEKTCAWVKVLDESKGTGSFSTHDYSVQKDHPKAGAVIRIAYSGEVTVHQDLVRPADLSAGPTAAAKATPAAEPMTKSHFAHARRRKSSALQAAIAASPGVAILLMCKALLGAGTGIALRVDGLEDQNRVINPTVRTTIEALLPRLASAAPEGYEFDGRGCTLKDRSWGTDRSGLWHDLMALSEIDAYTLFSALVALRVGSFSDFDPDLGDKPEIVAIAGTLRLIGTEDRHGLGLQMDDLDGIRKDALADMARAINVPGKIETMTSGALKQAIGDHYPPGFVVPSLRFGVKEDLQNLLKGKPDPAEVAQAFAADGTDGTTIADRVRRILALTIDADPADPRVANDATFGLPEWDAQDAADAAERLIQEFGFPPYKANPTDGIGFPEMGFHTVQHLISFMEKRVAYEAMKAAE